MEGTSYVADAHPPREIARRVERLGVAKAQTDTVTLVVLAVLAGAFISLGAPSPLAKIDPLLLARNDPD
jgi:formate/nitrite transporter FocA (FNT family)